MGILRALLAGVLALGATATSQAASYRIRPLDALPGQKDVYALGVNDAQHAVGYVIDADGRRRAAVWDPAGLTLLPPLASGQSSWAFRVNNHDQIVGKVALADGSQHAALWENRSLRDLGTLPGGKNSFAADINELGVVAGSSEAAVGSSAFTWTADAGFQAFGATDPPLRLAVAGFNGINDAGLAVGTTYILLEPFRAALARPGDRVVSDISPPGRTLGMALAVNNGGLIVGYQSEPLQSPQAAIFHGDGTFEALGTLGLDESWAQDVNDAGTIVGRAFSFGPGGALIPKAFVYEQGLMTDLLTQLANPDGWSKLIESTAISNSGVIVGQGIFEGEVRAFLAVPVPEPATGRMLLLAAAGLGLVWRAAHWHGQRALASTGSAQCKGRVQSKGPIQSKGRAQSKSRARAQGASAARPS